ncbi:nudix hydrolase 2 isoform X1 [Prunus yedoensis var. nudiflora]|uniref:Nudix hydrolase 2 isoform X1 n=1 Tax=Prunus yedoensis var. nudiflora TaxID=2094558 RepID=A0A314ZN51_PRUYE|nr:nudix hydrolase 2 isoform X1 [Prunus yedoensis var. nudiflora]
MSMQSFRATSKLLPHLSANKISPVSSSLVLHHPYPKRPSLGTHAPYSSSWPKDPKDKLPSWIQDMSVSTSSSSSVAKQAIMPEDGVEQIELLSAVEDLHGGVVVDLKEVMDSEVFSSLLRASMSQWKQKGKKGVWIKLPIKLSNLVDAAVKEGFRYHHAEPDYLMLVRWIPETIDTLPANASHRVGIGAYVMNSERKILVVQEISGRFKDTGVWKLPTGVVNEGEDICAAAVLGESKKRQEQSHKSFFQKSDLFFVCMLKPHSFDIETQNLEIAAAQWMPVEEYAAQPFVRQNKMFDYVAEICLAKSDKDYAGFSPMRTTTSSGKRSYLYYNKREMDNIQATGDHQ